MAYSIKQFRLSFFNIIPVFLLFIISLNGISIINLGFLSINIHFILVYYYILRRPEILGYGFIFISGIISDVIFGLPLGINALALLSISAVAAYVRNVTVRINLLNDWISFIPAVLFANFIYFISLYFSDISINYLYLFQNSIFTFIFYPILWIIFSFIENFSKN